MNAGKWSRRFVEEYLLPNLLDLQTVAQDEYWSLVTAWRLDRDQQSATFDIDRFGRLREMTDERLAQILSPHSRRLLFNVSRALRPAELRRLLGAPDPDGQLFVSVTTIATRAIALYGQRRNSMKVGSASVVALTPREAHQLRLLPKELARTFGLAALRSNAESGYRCAGKGLTLARKPAVDEIVGQFVPPGWEFDPNSQLERAIIDYERRRRNAIGSIGGLGALDDWETADWWWPTVGMPSVPVSIDYPALNLSHVTESYILLPKDVTRRLRQIRDFSAEFEATFGLAATSFGSMCRVLAEAIWHQSGFRELRPRDPDEDPSSVGFRFVSTLGTGDPRQEWAPGYMRDILEEGVLRAAREEWRAMLSRPLTEGETHQDTRSADTFIDAFTTSIRKDPRSLNPILFHDLEENSLVLDLALFGEFFDLCFHAAMESPLRKTGNRRGRFFEQQAVEILRSRLLLTDEQTPLPPNYKVRTAGLVEDEVDFCFTVGTVLVHMDMKSRRRTQAYHRGDYKAVRKRQGEFVKMLREQVDPRGLLLLGQLRNRGLELDRVVNLLCVADVEFVSPERADLWYGETPRVLTPNEIADLVEHPQQWQDVTRHATTVP
jgi:hypothetical protein